MRKIISILLSLLILIVSLSGCSTSVPAIEKEPPDNDWQFDTPENHGVDGAVLDRLHDAIKDIDIYSVVIAKDGYIIDEYYKQGYNERSVFRLNSCAIRELGGLCSVPANGSETRLYI